MNRPEALVSIIIPVYNAERYLADTIRSATAQTWANKEIIVVDDGSTDNSRAVAEKFKGPSVKIFKQPNKGASAARNKGLSEAKGEYIQFLDADDLLSNDKIMQQMKLLQNDPGRMAVCSSVHFLNGEDPLQKQPSGYEEAFLFDSNYPAHFLVNLWGGYSENGSMIQPNAWLTPVRLITKAGHWNETLSVDDDGEFFCRMLLASNGVIKTLGLNYYRKYNKSGQNLSAGKKLENYTSLYHSLMLRYKHISEKNPSEQLDVACIKSLYALKNQIYPLFPSLEKEITGSIKSLGMDLSYEDNSMRKLKKIVRLLFDLRLGKLKANVKNVKLW